MGIFNSILANAAITSGADYLQSDKFDPFYEMAGKLNLTVSLKINDQYSQLSKWEKLFVINFYGKNNNNIILEKPTNKGTKQEEIKKDINSELNRLYAIAEDENYFAISTEDNKFLEREFESELKALESQGKNDEAESLRQNKSIAMKKLAENFSKSQQEEYKNIVKFVKESDDEPAFKALILRETLLQTYKQVKEDGITKTIVEKRIPHKTLTGHMVINKTTLSAIYDNLDSYQSFANLYFAGIAILNNEIAKSSSINIENVNTFGMGQWIKFEGKKSNNKEYLKNAQKLSALVQNTPWCTKSQAATQLAGGDFYVFVDNDNNPHIAVRMNNEAIGEVRGIAPDGEMGQGIEEEYRPVAIEFLQKNKDIKKGALWLEKEETKIRKKEWGNRLVNWLNKFDEGESFSTEEAAQFMDDIYLNEFVNAAMYEQKNLVLKTLRETPIPIELRITIAQNLGCNVEDISFSKEEFNENTKYAFHDIDKSMNALHGENKLEIIFGNADFNYDNTLLGRGGKDIDLSNLKIIHGNCDFRGATIRNLSNLKIINGYANFKGSKVEGLNNLETIGNSADFIGARITDLSSLKSIEGFAWFNKSEITDLSSLETIGGEADFRYSQMTTLSSLKSIGGDAWFKNSEITDLSSLESIGGDADFRCSQVTDISSLESIGNHATFISSKITDFGKLKEIDGIVIFGEIKELDGKMIELVDENTAILKDKFEKEFEIGDRGKYIRKPEYLPQSQKNTEFDF